MADLSARPGKNPAVTIGIFLKTNLKILQLFVRQLFGASDRLRLVWK